MSRRRPSPGQHGDRAAAASASASATAPQGGTVTPTPRFHVVLVEPEIPPNTGNIGRLCVAAGAALHLVGPLGFDLDDRALRRAGLDYWHRLDVTRWASLAELEASAGPAATFHLLTSKAGPPYWSATFQPGDYLVFGPESRGLPSPLLQSRPGLCLTIPMPGAGARSLNLATAAGIVLYEALRQNSPPQSPPPASPPPRHH